MTDALPQKAARIAGLAYVLSLAIVVVSQFAVLGPLIVAGHPDETARNILAHETRFRAGVMMNLAYGACVVVVLSAFYAILRFVDETVAILAAFCRAVFAMLWILIARNELTALGLVSDPDYTRVFGPQAAHILARLYLSGFDGYYVGLLFWSVAATLCAYLWLRSRYIPRALAVFGIIASAWCLACTVVYLIAPAFGDVVNLWWFDTPMTLFELGVGLWLLFRGLRR